MVVGSNPVAVTSPSDFAPASSKEFLDIQATIECGLTLKRVRDMIKTYSLCIELGDLVPRKSDLTLDHAANKRLSPEEVRDVLALRNTKQKNFEINKKSASFAVRNALTKTLWKENKDSQ